jgi:HD-GYP domain-containing protein (c-di-GMP phosphodiesterase class II)
LGDQFKFPPYKLIELGIAAFLHEIGIVKFPEQLYLTEGSLGTQDRKNITAHPLVAYQGLKAVATPPAVLLAVLEHHERMNGSGYPRQLTGDKISIYGKIISLVCTYESAISARPYKEAMDPHEFMLELLKDKGQNYDENAVRALVFLLSVFPIGSFVEMNNGAKGMVILSNPADPRYPIVRLLTDPEGSRLKDPIVFATRKDNPVQILRRIAKAEAAGLPVDA